MLGRSSGILDRSSDGGSLRFLVPFLISDERAGNLCMHEIPPSELRAQPFRFVAVPTRRAGLPLLIFSVRLTHRSARQTRQDAASVCELFRVQTISHLSGASIPWQMVTRELHATSPMMPRPTRKSPSTGPNIPKFESYGGWITAITSSSRTPKMTIAAKRISVHRGMILLPLDHPRSATYALLKAQTKPREFQ